MPIQAPQWTEFLSCPVCRHSFTRNVRPPISLGCGHTICQQCLSTLQRSQCPFDQTPFKTEPENLPINYALLQLVLPGTTSTANYGGNNGGDGQGSGPTTTASSSLTTSTSSSSSSSNGSNIMGGGGSSSNNNAAAATTTEMPSPESSNSNNNNNKVTNNNNNNNNGAPKRDSDPSGSAEIVPLSVRMLSSDDYDHYKTAKECIEALALYLKPSPSNNASNNLLTRQMQRKVVALICCQLFEEEGRSRAVRAARLLGERAVTELILHHQNPQQLSANLWAAVRARGCQFLGPAMQEEVLKLVLLALEDGSALSRKVLVMFVVSRLEPVYSQASKTSIGHVVQLLYRASCFKVSKREGDSSLMQLKEEFRTYEALRREHDTQIVQIATEAGLRIAPDQWSSLLYGDTTHKSHMQSINDKLQTPESFSQSVQELVLALQRTSDPAHLSNLQPCLKYLADIDPNAEQNVPTWQQVAQACSAVRKVVTGLADFVQHHGSRKLQEITNANPAPKFKVNMCWMYTQRGNCPRGNKCNFAHSEAELNQSKSRHSSRQSTMPPQSNQMGPQLGTGTGPKDDFFLLDQFGKKPLGHMPSVETSPMRFPTSSGGGGHPMGAMGKGSPLPPQQQSSNQLLLPQPYNNDMMMPMGPGPGGGPPPMNHPGHHHAVHHHQGHSPLHVPYSGGGPPPQPPSSLHPYHGAGAGPHYNSVPTPNQLSPLGKFGFDPTKFNPNVRVSPNLGAGGQQIPVPPQQTPPPQAMPHPGRSPRNFPNHNAAMGKGGGGGGYNQNMFMNEMMGPQSQMGLVPPPPHAPNNNSMGKPNAPTLNMNEFGNKNDYLGVPQQQQQQQGKSGHPPNTSPFYWRKPPNQMPPNSPGGPQSAGQQQQQIQQQQHQPQNMMKSPSHLVGQMGKPHMQGPQLSPMNKGGGYPGLQNASLNDIMSPRQPIKNSPTFFGKEEMPYWNMGPQQQQQQQQVQSHQQQQQVHVEAMHRDPNRGAMISGANPGPQSALAHHHMSHLYADNASSNSRRMFDRSDSILTGEDAPFEGNATTSKFGPIERKPSNSLGTGDTLKSSLSGLDLRQQAWLNSSQASSLQTSPRLPPMHGLEKQLSPAKDMGNNQHLTLSNDPLISPSTSNSSHGLVSSALWPTGVGALDVAVNNGGASGGLTAARYVWSDKPYGAMGSASCRSSSASKLMNLDTGDDEKDIENGMLEISKKLATELVDDDFAT